MKSAITVAMLVALLVGIFSCQKDTDTCTAPQTYIYYSDYFVFVANDGGSPLVIPMDMNWKPINNGYEKEFKSWHGTANPWPINYLKQDVSVCTLPQESWEHTDDTNFQFNSTTRQISSNIAGGPTVAVTIPPSSAWVQLPDSSNYKELYAFKTSATVDGNSRSGWMIYERIRREAALGPGGDFKAFYWMPIVVNGNFYYFQDHSGVQSACRWVDNGSSIVAETIPSFTLNILATASDATSGRNNVVSQLQIIAPAWNIDLTLNSTGNQIGYGPQFPNGLGLYRQSLLEPAANSVTTGYGMLELILEDD